MSFFWFFAGILAVAVALWAIKRSPEANPTSEHDAHHAPDASAAPCACGCAKVVHTECACTDAACACTATPSECVEAPCACAGDVVVEDAPVEDAPVEDAPADEAVVEPVTETVVEEVVAAPATDVVVDDVAEAPEAKTGQPSAS